MFAYGIVSLLYMLLALWTGWIIVDGLVSFRFR